MSFIGEAGGNPDILSTFDNGSATMTSKNILNFPDQPVEYTTISPVSSLLDDRTSAVKFTYEFFLAHPELFGNNAETLLYVQQAGHRYKPEQYYTVFETFIKQVNKQLIHAAATTGVSNRYTFDIDYLITWARLLQTHAPYEFEPVLKQVKAVFRNWLQDQHVTYSGISYPISAFRALAYTYSGENIIELLPYICYLFTFLIHCNPYEFCDGTSESSSFGFYRTLNNWFMTHYELLAKDFGVDIIKDPAGGLQKIPQADWMATFDAMLNVEQIIKIRNDEISKVESLLQQCIQDQTSIDYAYVYECWDNVMSNLITIIVQNSPIKQIFDTIPRLDIRALNVTNLFMLTQYVMTGGDKQFCIDPDTYTYALNADPTTVKPVLKFKQSLKAGVNRLTVGHSKPFCSSDLLTEMCTSYIRDLFLEKRQDPLDPHPILVNEDSLRDLDADILANLFLPGIWSFDNSVMSTVVPELLKHQQFLNEFNDILALGYITEVCYNNRLASVILPTLMLSYINTYILQTCIAGYPLDKLSVMTEAILQLTAKQESVQQRIYALCNTCTSLLYLAEPEFTNFVNNSMTEFVKIVTFNPIIMQPYVKGLDDSADVYAMGGVELYNYGHFSNPLIRAYGFISNVFGTCESLETFYRHIEQLDNDSLFDIINDIAGYGKQLDTSSTATVEAGLKTQYGKHGVRPMLNNFAFDGLKYTVKNTPYYLSMKTSEGNFLLDILCRYTFAYNDPHKAINKCVAVRNIQYVNGQVTAIRPTVDKMRVGNSSAPVMLSSTGSVEQLPTYDYLGKIVDTGIIYTAPNGYRQITIRMMSPRSAVNSIMWIFTPVAGKSRFQRYQAPRSGPTSHGILGNRGKPDPRRR